MVIFAPRAREVLIDVFSELASHDANAADALRARLDDAVERLERDPQSGEILVLPGGRAVHRLRVDSLSLFCERHARGVRVLLVERA